MAGDSGGRAVASTRENSLVAADRMDLSESVNFFRRQFKLIVLITCAALVLGLVISLLIGRTYRAESTVMLTNDAAIVTQSNAASSPQPILNAEVVDTQIEIITSQQMAKRVAQSLRFLTSGYQADVDQVINNALFTVDYSEMVIVKDVDFYSLCEHHLLPFFGKCHIAYIPQGRVIGLSKIPRLVDVFARRLQVQERLTNQIAEVILEKIAPLGVAVVMEGTHLCMSMRGVEKQNSFAVTSAMLGVFREDARTRSEFLELIKHRAPVPSASDALSVTGR